MKKLIIVFLSLSVFVGVAWADVLCCKEAHERYIYPTVRVSGGYGVGSGTVVYSQSSAKGITDMAILDKIIADRWSTYILTNFHVVASLIKITEIWDSDLQKNVKKERRGIAYVEIFKYKNLSIPVGTTKLEADIVVYNREEDMALLKLRYEGVIEYVATLPIRGKESDYKVMDESVAVGCSLGWPPLVSAGLITRKNYQVRSLPYDMSSAQIIFGNSGGGMYSQDGVFMGIPSMVAVIGWSAAVPHMGLFIPVKRIYDWWEKEHYDFIYDDLKVEVESLELRKKEIEAKKKKDA